MPPACQHTERQCPAVKVALRGLLSQLCGSQLLCAHEGGACQHVSQQTASGGTYHQREQPLQSHINPPTAPTKFMAPKARPLLSAGLKSAMRLWMQGMTMASPRPLKPQNTMACRINACFVALSGG